MRKKFGKKNRRKTLIIEPIFRYNKEHGEVSEWFKEAVLKTVILARVSWVRIPPSPPDRNVELFIEIRVIKREGIAW